MLHDANPQRPVNRKILFQSGIRVNSRVINGIYFIMNGISHGYTCGLFSRIIFYVVLLELLSERWYPCREPLFLRIFFVADTTRGGICMHKLYGRHGKSWTGRVKKYDGNFEKNQYIVLIFICICFYQDRGVFDL